MNITYIFGPGTVAVSGTRWPVESTTMPLRQIVTDLAMAGHTLLTGCCIGTDAAVIRMARPNIPVGVLAIFGPHAGGACGMSAVAPVLLHAGAGGSVRWWAGGQPRLPVRQRLRSRTLALGQACTAGALVVFGRRASAGTALLARTVAARGLPVVALGAGRAAEDLPDIGAGAWCPLAHTEPDVLAMWVPPAQPVQTRGFLAGIDRDGRVDYAEGPDFSRDWHPQPRQEPTP